MVAVEVAEVVAVLVAVDVAVEVCVEVRVLVPVLVAEVVFVDVGVVLVGVVVAVVVPDEVAEDVAEVVAVVVGDEVPELVTVLVGVDVAVDVPLVVCDEVAVDVGVEVTVEVGDDVAVVVCVVESHRMYAAGQSPFDPMGKQSFVAGFWHSPAVLVLHPTHKPGFNSIAHLRVFAGQDCVAPSSKSTQNRAASLTHGPLPKAQMPGGHSSGVVVIVVVTEVVPVDVAVEVGVVLLVVAVVVTVDVGVVESHRSKFAGQSCVFAVNGRHRFVVGFWHSPPVDPLHPVHSSTTSGSAHRRAPAGH